MASLKYALINLHHLRLKSSRSSVKVNYCARLMHRALFELHRHKVVWQWPMFLINSFDSARLQSCNVFVLIGKFKIRLITQKTDWKWKLPVRRNQESIFVPLSYVFEVIMWTRLISSKALPACLRDLHGRRLEAKDFIWTWRTFPMRRTFYILQRPTYFFLLWWWSILMYFGKLVPFGEPFTYHWIQICFLFFSVKGTNSTHSQVSW